MKKLRFISLLFMAFVLSGCSFPSFSSSGLVLKGVVEAPVFSNSSEVPGKIINLPIELGQSVKAGDVIAIIDDSDAKYALEQLKDTLLKKQAALAELKTGAEAAQIKQAQNNVSIAQQTLGSAQLNNTHNNDTYARCLQLYHEGAIAKDALDDAKYQLDLSQNALNAANTQVDNARQALTLLKTGATQAQIASAQADIALTESQIQQANDKLAKYTLIASTDGTVISKNYLLGDIVASGYNIADISPDDEKYLVAYLPVDDLHKISYGQELAVKSGGKAYKGKVSFIDLESEYTPKDMQTSSNKNKDSVKIKVRLPQDTPLKPGEKADLVIE